MVEGVSFAMKGGGVDVQCRFGGAAVFIACAEGLRNNFL